MRWLRLLGVGSLAGLLAAFALFSGAGESWDHAWQNSVALVAWPDVQPSRTLALVRIDDSTLSTHGEGKWPLTRLTYATALLALRNVSPRVAVLEVPMLPDPEARSVFDAAFATQAQRLNAVVIAATGLRASATDPSASPPPQPLERLPFSCPRDLLLPRFSGISPMPESLSGSMFVGLGNLPFDPRHGITSIPLLCQINDALAPSLLLRSVMAWDGVLAQDVHLEAGRALSWTTSEGKRRIIPLDRHGGVRPLRWHPVHPAPDIGLDTLVVATDPRSSGLLQHPALGHWNGRALWILRSAPSTYTPIPVGTGTMSPGDIWSAGWDAILSGTQWRDCPRGTGLAGCLGAGVLSALIAGSRRSRWQRWLLLLLGAAAMGTVAYAAAWQLLSLPLLPWLGAWGTGSLLGYFTNPSSRSRRMRYEFSV